MKLFDFFIITKLSIIFASLYTFIIFIALFSIAVPKWQLSGVMLLFKADLILKTANFEAYVRKHLHLLSPLAFFDLLEQFTLRIDSIVKVCAFFIACILAGFIFYYFLFKKLIFNYIFIIIYYGAIFFLLITALGIDKLILLFNRKVKLNAKYATSSAFTGRKLDFTQPRRHKLYNIQAACIHTHSGEKKLPMPRIYDRPELITPDSYETGGVGERFFTPGDINYIVGSVLVSIGFGHRRDIEIIRIICCAILIVILSLLQKDVFISSFGASDYQNYLSLLSFSFWQIAVTLMYIAYLSLSKGLIAALTSEFVRAHFFYFCASALFLATGITLVVRLVLLIEICVRMSHNHFRAWRAFACRGKPSVGARQLNVFFPGPFFAILIYIGIRIIFPELEYLDSWYMPEVDAAVNLCAILGVCFLIQQLVVSILGAGGLTYDIIEFTTNYNWAHNHYTKTRYSFSVDNHPNIYASKFMYTAQPRYDDFILFTGVISRLPYLCEPLTAWLRKNVFNPFNVFVEGRINKPFKKYVKKYNKKKSSTAGGENLFSKYFVQPLDKYVIEPMYKTFPYLQGPEAFRRFNPYLINIEPDSIEKNFRTIFIWIGPGDVDYYFSDRLRCSHNTNVIIKHFGQDMYQSCLRVIPTSFLMLIFSPRFLNLGANAETAEIFNYNLCEPIRAFYICLCVFFVSSIFHFLRMPFWYIYDYLRCARIHFWHLGRKEIRRGKMGPGLILQFLMLLGGVVFAAKLNLFGIIGDYVFWISFTCLIVLTVLFILQAAASAVVISDWWDDVVLFNRLYFRYRYTWPRGWGGTIKRSGQSSSRRRKK